MKRFLFRELGLVMLVLGGVALAPRAAHGETLLSYWNFNNEASGHLYNGGTLGQFSTADAGFGEVYDSGTRHLSSNTSASVGAVYSGSDVYVDFSLTPANPNASANAGTTSDINAWGAFSDSGGQNLAAGDSSTQQGSLILDQGSEAGALAQHITLKLDSQGYQGLTLSYSGRATAGQSGTETWSYSLDGTNYIPIGTVTPGNGSFADLSLSLPGAVANQSTFYLQMTASFPSWGSAAVDNLQLTAASAVPEPGVSALLLGTLLLGGGFWLRSRRAFAEPAS